MDTKLKAVRAGHRGAVTKLLKIFDEIQHSSEIDNENISTLLDSITRKQNILVDLDEKIMEQSTEDNVAEEIEEADEYMYNLEYKIKQIRKLSQTVSSSQSLPASKTSQLNPNADNFIPSAIIQSNVASSYTCNPQVSENRSFMGPSTHVESLRSSYSTNSEYHKLPKLSLPTFDGDILEWQSFWDSYETAVHANLTLSDVHKFNYLKSLLHSEALQTIAGFSMTNTNYGKAIALLQERYGQTHVIIQSYMQALLDVPAPIYSLVSLRSYYDKTETYVRGLESLGQKDETYGSLLVPVILNKLPAEMRQHLAREHTVNKLDTG